MRISKLLPVIVSAMLVAASYPSSAEEAVPGTVTLARGGSHSLLVWNASPLVASLTSAKTPHDRALAQLESDAMRIAVSHADQLAAAQDVTVRVVYMKMGSVDPAYGVPTLAGVEKLFTLEASRSDLASKGSAWVAEINAQKTPHDVTVSVTGQLPPV